MNIATLGLPALPSSASALMIRGGAMFPTSFDPTSLEKANKSLYVIGHAMIGMWSYTSTIIAARTHMDLIGCQVVAFFAVLGGGTFRDVILGRGVFWVSDPSYIYTVAIASLLTFFAWPFLEQGAGADASWYVLPDAVGMAYFSVFGAHVACALRRPAVVCVMSGLCTGTFGGIAQDLLCQRKIRLLYAGTQLYTLPALLSAVVYTLWVGDLGSSCSSKVDPVVGGVVAWGLGLALRMAAIKHDLKLPAWLSVRRNQKKWHSRWEVNHPHIPHIQEVFDFHSDALPEEDEVDIPKKKH